MDTIAVTIVIARLMASCPREYTEHQGKIEARERNGTERMSLAAYDAW